MTCYSPVKFGFFAVQLPINWILDDASSITVEFDAIIEQMAFRRARIQNEEPLDWRTRMLWARGDGKGRRTRIGVRFDSALQQVLRASS
jgi:hypothetical protein